LRVYGYEEHFTNEKIEEKLLTAMSGSMKRIGIVVQRRHESVVGGAVALAWQYANLLKDDYEVDILTTTRSTRLIGKLCRLALRFVTHNDHALQ
jgi:hypothetical protein